VEASVTYIDLDEQTVGSEHICCAISDKKCAAGYEGKRRWLAREFGEGYVFRRLDERAKVFIEYGPAENAWMPVTAPGYLALGCFWVSGRYKGQGHGKALLESVADDAGRQGKAGLVAVVGTRKFHFMSDGKWLLGQGFEVRETLTSGFSLISLELGEQDGSVSSGAPAFNDSVRSGRCPEERGCVAYYSDRCPYAEYYVTQVLPETCGGRDLRLTTIKLESREQAQAAPTPATVFSLFLDGRFVTTDLSVCLDGRFDRIAGH
jgi:GNAT superfamily N-acetyltransferase